MERLRNTILNEDNQSSTYAAVTSLANPAGGVFLSKGVRGKGEYVLVQLSITRGVFPLDRIK